MSRQKLKYRIFFFLWKIELEIKLTAEEKSADKTLDIGSESSSEVEGDPHSLTDMGMKKFRVSQQSMKSKNMDTRFICRTSNRCESLFSGAKRALCKLRQSMSPYHMECLMFLFANCKLWGISDVSSIVS